MDDRNKPEAVDFGKTTPNLRNPEHDTARIQPFEEPPPKQTRVQPPRPRPRRRIPIWVWLGAGVAFLLFLMAVAVLVYFLTREPGFTMVVVGAPPGSAVYVDNISRGVTSADGTIRVSGLKAGKRLLRVSNEGYTEFNTSVTAKDGEVRRVVVQLTSAETKASLPNEIDLNGPMLLVGAGEFTMGDDNHNPDEKPTHRVTLPDFYIDKFEVTNEQYKKFCDATHRPCPTNPWWDDHYLTNHPRSPVLGVSWNDADAYAKWAGKRLPTEEEWEKAASWDSAAQKKRQWPWGDNADASRANVGGTQRTTDVGQFPSGASPYGVQDIAGNVAEWVNAFYQPYPGNQTTSPEMGTKNRVVRGGTYKGDIEDARTPRRLFHTPQLLESEKKNRAFLIGFRSAISADDPRLQQRLGRSEAAPK